MVLDIEAKSLSIVVVGSFNPAIVQPFWLAKKGLIRDEEAENAKIEIIHNEFSRFNLDWALIEVRPDRFEINTTQEPYFEVIRDLVIGIFSSLNETPVSALGINSIYHSSSLSKNKYFEIGNKLAPLTNWDFLNNPKVLHVEILEDHINGRDTGYKRIKVQSSNKITDSIMLSINDHYELDSEKNNLVTLINNNWKDSITRSESIVKDIWDKLNKND